MHQKHASLTLVAIHIWVINISDMNTIQMYQTFLPLVVNRSAVKIQHTGSKYLPHGSSISCL